MSSIIKMSTITSQLLKGVLHLWQIQWMFMQFSQKLQHIGNK